MVNLAGIGKTVSYVYDHIVRYGSPEDASVLPKLRAAHKFVFDAQAIPRALFDGAADFTNQLSSFGIMRLPFDSVVFVSGPWGEDLIDSDAPEEWKNDRVTVLLAWQDGDDIMGRCYQVNASCRGQVLMNPRTFVIKSGFQSDVETFTRLSKNHDELYECVIDDKDAHDVSDYHLTCGLSHFVFSLYSGIGCLSSSGIGITETKEPVFINKQRERKGKAPLFGYRLVSVDMSAIKIPGTHTGGTHATPRLHWRRGHIRRLPDGRLTTVKPCLVGDPSLGSVAHDYSVAAGKPNEALKELYSKGKALRSGSDDPA